jgi:hypothetical protein
MPSGGANKIFLSDDTYRQVETLAGFGLTRDKIALVIGISLATLTRHKKNDKRFADAYARGIAKAEGMVARTLYDRATKDGGDMSAIKWWEQTRAGRVETSRHDVIQETTIKVRVVPHAE